MPQVRRIKRVVNALINQQRMIYHLECGHNLSVTSRQITDSALGVAHYLSAEQAICNVCLDPPPEDPRRIKSARQLWKEAGEPA